MIRVRDNEQDIEASRQVDRATQALVPSCAPGTLPTDPKHLNAMFVFCTNNWRTYSGEKPKGDKLVSMRRTPFFLMACRFRAHNAVPDAKV